MEIYKFECISGETDWVYAPNIKEAKDFYVEFTGCYSLDNYIVSRVPKKDWNNHFIFDINESEPDPEEENYNEDDYCSGYKIEESFADYAKRNTETDIIATTEF